MLAVSDTDRSIFLTSNTGITVSSVMIDNMISGSIVKAFQKFLLLGYRITVFANPACKVCHSLLLAGVIAAVI